LFALVGAILENTSIIVKTMLRPSSLRRLVKSICCYYPSSPILIGNDQPNEPNPLINEDFSTTNIHYFRLPEDCGLSAARNALVAKVVTPYTVVVEDDFEFVSSTNLAKLKKYIDEYNYDVVAGQLLTVGNTETGWRCTGTLQKHFGLMHRVGNKLQCEAGFLSQQEECKEVEITLNFFLAKTSSLKNHPWDEELKLGEHQDWFLRAKGKLKVGVVSSVIALHHVCHSENYLKYRNRLLDYQRLFMSKHNLQELNFTPVQNWE
jgi:hypothetical protein